MSKIIKSFSYILMAFLCFQASASEYSFSINGEESEGEIGDLNYVRPLNETSNWQVLINRFGGRIQNPTQYTATADGFKNFLTDSGVSEYDPIEIITPVSKDVAKKCGIDYLLPDRSKWPQGAAIALWAQAITQVAQEKPTILNWYRSPCYNKAVGGAKASDHMEARSADLDFVSEAARRRAQNWLCSFWNSSLNMQIGLGGSVIHLGSQSPRGKRNWFYPTYKDSDRGKTCFDK